MALREFKLPDPGEGLTEAELVTWHVAVGDTVRVNDVVVEVETAKSLVELPVPFAGTVAALHAAEGDTVEVGTVIITIDDPSFIGSPDEPPLSPTSVPPDGGGSSGTATPDAVAPASAPASPPTGASAPAGAPASEAIAEGLIGGTTSTGRTAVLVGYGVRQTEAKRRPRTSSRPEKLEGPGLSGKGGGDVAIEPLEPLEPLESGAEGVPLTGARVRALAKPPVRKLAKDLGVDLASVTPTGDGGVVTRADVEAAAAGGGPSSAAGATASGGGMPVGAASWPAGGERESRVPIKGVRKMTAQAMVGSAFTAPHVTEWVTVDVTATMDLVDRLKKDREFRDVKVTPLLVLARAMCVAVRRNPGVNASWDEAAQEIVLKHYVNLGIAAATPRGLVVPNVKDADRMTMHELAEAIGALTATAREGRTQPADMAGGTITITNVGVFGVDAGTPILNPGESAIMAFGAIDRRPWVVTGPDGAESIEPRWVTTLALSFDHRLVDGELGSRYLADVAAILADPARGLVWG
ncbi:dihydrolipoamide acetyltransferase family protein [Fodinibacter luteus]|uniref:Dihydrolipoamide acetyltransferase component of pyruvate dehydrogenase complex n=1 Tax=Fodinibacter luteus TaxID=552064 RepID=A0ABP8KNZ4_9MICO